MIALVSLGLCGSLIRSENDSDCIEVIDLLERHVLGLHLVPDGIRCLHPFLYAEIESGIREGLLNGRNELVNALFLV